MTNEHPNIPCFALSTNNREAWSRPEFWLDQVPSFLKVENKPAAAETSLLSLPSASSSSSTPSASSLTTTGNNADIRKERRRVLGDCSHALLDEPSADEKLIVSSLLSASSSSVSSSTATTTDNNNAEMGTERRQVLRDRGYALLDESFADEKLITQLRQGVEHLHRRGLPASFILLYDITWELARKSWKVLQSSTREGNKFQFDILAWYIASDGFSPHRDRQPEDDHVLKSFDESKDAKFITHWIALTEATPENSCLYMIPKDQDPGYFKGDTESSDPLQRALPDKRAFQHIRAMPRQAGQSILFSHRIIHWGSARDPNTKLPCRIAISFVCSDPSYERPYVDPKYFDEKSTTTPPFHIRLLLVCAQMLIYYQRFDLDKDFIKACYKYCKDHEEELEESYRQKVFVEFVKAMKEQREVDSKGAPDLPREDVNDDEEEEAMMEEMLQAAKKGYTEFEDDYDEEFGDGDDNFGDDDDEEEEEEEGTLQFGKRDAVDGDQEPPPAADGEATKKRRTE